MIFCLLMDFTGSDVRAPKLYHLWVFKKSWRKSKLKLKIANLKNSFFGYFYHVWISIYPNIEYLQLTPLCGWKIVNISPIYHKHDRQQVFTEEKSISKKKIFLKFLIFLQILEFQEIKWKFKRKTNLCWKFRKDFHLFYKCWWVGIILYYFLTKSEIESVFGVLIVVIFSGT